MKISKFKTWQTLLLFIPLVAGMLVFSLPAENFQAYHRHSSIANFLLTLGMLVIISYPAFLVVGFNNSIPVKSSWLSVNALIPVGFFAFYVLYVSYFTWIKPVIYTTESPGLKIARLNVFGKVIMVFMIYATLNFFLSPFFVESRIKALADINERKALTASFLMPIKRFIRLSVCVAGGAFILILIADIFTFAKMSG